LALREARRVGKKGNGMRKNLNGIFTLRTCTLLLTAHTLVAQNAYITGNAGAFSVVNTATDTVMTTQRGLAFGMTLAADGSKVYTADHQHGIIYVTDTATTTSTGLITVFAFADPWGLAVMPDGSKLYAAMSDNTVSVIDTAARFFASIPVGAGPKGVAVTPDGSKVYVTNSVDGTVSVINTATNTVSATIPVGSSPWGVAVTLDGSRVYVANHGTVSVIDTSSDAVISTISGIGGAAGLAVTPDGSAVYVANFQASDGLSFPLSGAVSVINTATNTVSATIPVGAGPFGVDVTPNGSRVYVASQYSNTVSVINTATNTVIDTVTTGSGPSFFGPIAFGLFIQPLPFSSFNTKLSLVPASSGRFDLNSTLVLSPSASIDPVTEPLTLSVGPYGVTIPAGSFQPVKNGSKQGGWNLSGNIGGVNLAIQIAPLGGGAYQVKASGTPVNFTGVTSPATVSISIHRNAGITQAAF